jgi:hypothetical protein
VSKVLAGLLPLALLAAALVTAASANRGERVGKASGAARFSVTAGQDERIRLRAGDGGPAAQDRGKIHYRNATAGFSYRARLVCVDVDGSTARFGYVIPDREGVPASIRGLGVVFQVVDNGKPDTGKDTVGYVSGTAASATACDATAVSAAQQISSGNLRVKQASATQAKTRRHRDR